MDTDRRFGGLARLYGKAGAERIANAHIAVVGIGGVGSWAAEALARSGVGKLTLIDLDHIAESNINRQVHALSSSLGQAKVLAMQERIAQINPDCQVETIEDFVDGENWPSLLAPTSLATLGGVIDACDQQKAKLAMVLWAKRSKFKNLVSVGAAGGKRLAKPVEIADLSQVSHDPLLASLRYQLRKNHGFPKDHKKMAVTCVFSREAVLNPKQDVDSCAVDHSLNCHGYGSTVTVTASFGFAAANFLLEALSSAN